MRIEGLRAQCGPRLYWVHARSDRDRPCLSRWRSVDGAPWKVTRTYDSLSRIKSEDQGGYLVSYDWAEEGKRTALHYPTAGFYLDYTYDHLDRISDIIEGGGNSVAAYEYAGKSRVLEKVMGNGTASRLHTGGTSTWDDTLYYDAARRPTLLEHVGPQGLQTALSHAYDRMHNRLYEGRTIDVGSGVLAADGDNYVYDDIYRLTTFERDVPAADLGVPGLGNERWRSKLAGAGC